MTLVRRDPAIFHGNCLDVLRSLPDECIDAVVTDPPYGLSQHSPELVAKALTAWMTGDRDHVPSGKRGFMGNEWDGFVPPPAVWDECYRVLKPGGHMLVFAGSRTQDLMGISVRLAGFEIRDTMAWLYAQGFPKSYDVSRAVDAHEKLGGSSTIQKRKASMGEDYVPGETVGRFRTGEIASMDNPAQYAPEETSERTENAEKWRGWGTALKPGQEPIIVARKPFPGSVAANVLAHGTGAMNIDATRIGFASEADEAESKAKNQHADFGTEPGGNAVYGDYSMVPRTNYDPEGRWPANVVISHLEECSQEGASVDRVGGGAKATGGFVDGYEKGDGWSGGDVATATWVCADGCPAKELDEQTGATKGGLPSRFFYSAKANAKERITAPDGTRHPTVKPLALMRWLCRLVTPPGGAVLDPFAGSGTTVEAALLEGFRAAGIEAEEKYIPLILARVERAGR